MSNGLTFEILQIHNFTKFPSTLGFCRIHENWLVLIIERTIKKTHALDIAGRLKNSGLWKITLLE